MESGVQSPVGWPQTRQGSRVARVMRTPGKTQSGSWPTMVTAFLWIGLRYQE